MKRSKENRITRPGSRNSIKRNLPLYVMLAIPMLYIITFGYAPLAGVTIAFKQYNIFQGIWASPWVGFKHFKEVFAAREFQAAIQNTIILNLGELFINFPFPIVLAVLLNEMSSQRMKKVTQTVLYLPHFLSMVVIAGIMYQVFAANGMVNNALGSFGIGPVNFLGDPGKWRAIYWGSGIWMGAGYGMIVYLAAMAGINVELYDAAYIDGAGRWKRIWHVTLPQIRPTIVTMTIMNVGKILSIGFERPYLMGNVLVRDVSSVISTYVYSVGLQAGRYDFATAVGLFQSVVAVCMVVAANQVAKKLGEEGIM
ncbi:putative aldouronate transport system permease protein [Anaerotaenia torta]|uniref:ABC transporter permease n=1 Tax=Anaerotaenia torta TaxID=433293 RepID=UPI003D1E1A06